MRLSLQTVSIIFGVTLVHLCIITALSPRGSEGSLTLPHAPESSDFHGPAEEGPLHPDELPSVPADLSSDPSVSPIGDAPAERRPSSEQTAIDVDQPALPPRQFSPLPQS